VSRGDRIARYWTNEQDIPNLTIQRNTYAKLV